jgi:ATP-dependent Clp protease ATP-binding subunit ClpC
MAIDHAKQGTGRLAQSYVSSAHLVLGLLTLRGGIGDNALRNAGLSIDMVERFLASTPKVVEKTVKHDGTQFGESAMEALTRAESEAAQANISMLGVEHLTLALLAEKQGAAAYLFASARIDPEKLRTMIRNELQF